MQMTGFKKTPMSIDINVNFMSAGKPGLTIARSKIIKLGNSIGFLSAELFQDNNLIATASSSIKLAAFPGIDFIKNNIGSDAEIIYK
jgi:acyl-coenzyme A thioesterase PaaI-like protein